MCVALDLYGATRLAQTCDVPWVRSVAADGDPDTCLLGDVYPFARKDPAGAGLEWWARQLLVCHRDGRSVLLALIPRLQNDGWVVIVKDRSRGQEVAKSLPALQAPPPRPSPSHSDSLEPAC